MGAHKEDGEALYQEVDEVVWVVEDQWVEVDQCEVEVVHQCVEAHVVVACVEAGEVSHPRVALQDHRVTYLKL